MNTGIARKILELSEHRGATIVYGAMSSATTVKIGGSETAVAVPILSSCPRLYAGDYVAALSSGPDIVIIGVVGGVVHESQQEVYALDSNGEVAISFTEEFPATPVISVTAQVATGVYTSTTVEAASSTGFTAQVWRNGAPDASVSRRLHWSAVRPTS